MEQTILRQDRSILYLGLAILITIVLLNHHPVFFDADIYMQDAYNLRRYGLGKEFLLSLNGSAGPLYGIVHYIFEPITHFKTPYVRFVNIIFLAGILVVLKRTLSLSGFSGGNYALYSMAIPMTYVSAGLALTEIPAMFFLSVGLYLIMRTRLSPYASYQFLSLAIAGFCIGLAIIGRQPFLLLLVALPLAFLEGERKAHIIKLLLVLAFAIPVPAYVFWVWKDFVPPYDAQLYDSIATTGTIFRADFFFVCIAYFAFVFAMLAPGFYRKPTKKVFVFLIASYVVIAIFNYHVKWIEFLPLMGAMRFIITTTEMQRIASNLAGSGLLLSSFCFLFTLYRQLKRLSWNRILLFYAVMLILIAISCIKITWGFSSRYPGQALPLLIPACSFFRTRTKLSTPFLAAGVAVGIFSLLSYIIDALNSGYTR